MNILVTGGAGYLGSVLLPKLLVRGHRARVIDIGYFGLGHLRNLHPLVDLIRDDLRRAQEPKFVETLLESVDCVLHLAAISNDPSAELQPDLTDEINVRTTLVLAEATRARRIPFVFSSSCSVYGEAATDLLAEASPLNPLTVYAVSKVKAEQALVRMADASWRPVILRNGTLFGYSPRMRFDLVVNIFSLYATLHNQIRIFGDGLQWRPFLHVSDCARAFVFFAELREPLHMVYNIANENLRVVDVAEIFRGLRPAIDVAHVTSADLDARNYSVSTDRAKAEGFQTRLDVCAGAEQMMEAIVGGAIPDPESIFYRNAKWLKELSEIGTRGHRQVVELMESFGAARRVV
jgi:nucleoside-diphosphate-sugar epimerase